ncbi:zinc finger protein 57-like isoform X1 [Cydia fagiglandana]|uniref:zinc finger protein 57-like isoform X1 n=1 Tax=Cydia fagiglandana TaxID=1458189 RepID=UPI002FEE0EBD
MSGTSRKGPVFDPGLCRCCGALKKCRLLNHEYDWQGKKEVYSDMFVDCFGLMLSHLDGSELERLICATCVLRLRDASAFRGQVLRCEETLLQASIHVHGENVTPEVKQEPEVKLEERPEEVSEPPEAPEDDVMDPDYVDDGVDNGDLDVTVAKPKKSLKKEKKKVKRREKRGKRELVEKMRKTGERLRKLEKIEIQPAVEKKRVVDADYKAYKDCVTLVESSFVCPFDTSFSDYFCVYCRQVFTDPDKLREHTLTHDPSAYKDIVTAVKKLPQIDVHRIDCRLCPVKIDTLDMFKDHLNNVHGMTFYPNPSDFLIYKLTLTNLTCLECNQTFGFFHALRKHMAEHFGTCICDVCGAHYFEERMLILHQKTHQRIDENFPCKDCGKNFKSKHSRYLHEARTHKKEPAYQCVKCDAVLFSYTLRYRHMIEVHGEERLFPCEHCDRAYDSRKSLREHNRRSHLKIFKHQCDLCDKRFYLPSRLKEHMATHTGERNYRCEYCGKSYPRLRGLKVHMQSHGAEKKFRCTLCGAAFTQNVNLRNHVKRQHQSLDLDEFHD